MPRVTLGLLGAVILFFVAVWAGAKWPSLNVISKVTG